MKQRTESTGDRPEPEDNPLLEALTTGDPEMGGAKPLTVEGVRQRWEDPGEPQVGRHLAGGVRPPDGRGRPRQAFTSSPPAKGTPPITRQRRVPKQPAARPVGRKTPADTSRLETGSLGREVAALFRARGYRVIDHPTEPSPVGFRARKAGRDYVIFCGPFAEPLSLSTAVACLREVEAAGAMRGFIFTRTRIPDTLWHTFAHHDLLYLIDNKERAAIRAKIGLGPREQ